MIHRCEDDDAPMPYVHPSGHAKRCAAALTQQAAIRLCAFVKFLPSLDLSQIVTRLCPFCNDHGCSRCGNYETWPPG